VTYLRLVRANLRRNRLRTALTGAAVALATLLVCLLLTMPAGLDAFVSRVASNTRISVVNRAGLVYGMPYAFVRKVRRLPGVADAVALVWFGGAYEERGKLTFPSFAVEPDHFGGVYPDYHVPAEQVAAFRRYRDAALVGLATMRTYRWRVGQRVTLRSATWPVDLDFRIVGVVPNPDLGGFYMSREYLDQALQAKGLPGLGIAGLIYVRAARPEDVKPIMRMIDDLSHNSDAPTTSQTEKSFFSSFLSTLKGFITIIIAVTALVSLCIVFIAGNTASLAVRERSAEIALLKALGFGRRPIFSMLIAETVLLSAVAGAIGVGLAVALTWGLRHFAGRIPELGPLGAFVVTGNVVVLGLALALLVGVVAGAAPAWGAARRPVAETMREVF
jgi:putative ABC transport system permease protein